MISSSDTPANQALEVAWALTSCARGLSWDDVCGLIKSLIQREIVSFEAGVKGLLGKRKSWSCFRTSFVFSRYHFTARTGHHRLSSGMVETVPRAGKKISWGVNDADWFLARNRGSGRSLMPSLSRRR